MDLPISPPLQPMLAKATGQVPTTGDYSFEPKWDGFRCIVFRSGEDIELGSRNEKPLTRYFPELLGPLRAQLPDRCVVDGEIVIATPDGLNFDLLSQRIHPAQRRIDLLAEQIPARFVAFDLVALGDRDLRAESFRERRAALCDALRDVTAPVHLCPATTDPAVAQDWFERFEGAGFDGVMAKPLDGVYESNKRAQLKVKHLRTADVVVAGYRTHKDGAGVGSLLLGLYDDAGTLHHIGVASAFSAARRAELVDELAPLHAGADDDHPWRAWAEPVEDGQRKPGAPSRWSSGRDQSWVPLRIERVAEVAYEHLQGDRLRHPARWVRWRVDKEPAECRYDQLDRPAPAELREVFGL